MSVANALFILAAGDSEDTFWTQLLVVVILAAGVGIYGMVKSSRPAKAVIKALGIMGATIYEDPNFAKMITSNH